MMRTWRERFKIAGIVVVDVFVDVVDMPPVRNRSVVVLVNLSVQGLHASRGIGTPGLEVAPVAGLARVGIPAKGDPPVDDLFDDGA